MPILIRDGVKTELNAENYVPQENDAIRVGIGEPPFTFNHGGAEVTISANSDNAIGQATLLISGHNTIHAIEGGVVVHNRTGAPYHTNTPTMMTTIKDGAGASYIAAPEGGSNSVVSSPNSPDNGVVVMDYGPINKGEGVTRPSMFHDYQALKGEKSKIALANASSHENSESSPTATAPQLASFSAPAPSTM